MTDLERLGFAVIGFMVAMIGVWIRLRGAMGGSECLVARDAAGGVGCGEEGGHPMTDYEANLTAAQFKITGVKSKGGAGV